LSNAGVLNSQAENQFKSSAYCHPISTIASVLFEALGLRELLEELLGPEGRRRLALKNKTNEELFTLYDAELVLKGGSTKNLEMTRQILTKFHSYLKGSKPSPDLAKGFLSQYSGRKPRTRARSATMPPYTLP
jgi:hypothetical protein